MPSLSDVSTIDFQQALTTEKLRVSQIVHLALGAGALVFALVTMALFLIGIGHTPDPGAFSTANILSGLNVLMALTFPIVGWVISNKQFSADRISSAVTEEFRNQKGEVLAATPAERCIMLIRTSSILQIATLEACAFFGLVVCVNSITEGVARVEPAYLFNAVTSLPLFAYIALTFPTKENFTNIFETKIRNNR